MSIVSAWHSFMFAAPQHICFLQVTRTSDWYGSMDLTGLCSFRHLTSLHLKGDMILSSEIAGLPALAQQLTELRKLDIEHLHLSSWPKLHAMLLCLPCLEVGAQQEQPDACPLYPMQAKCIRIPL